MSFEEIGQIEQSEKPCSEGNLYRYPKQPHTEMWEDNSRKDKIQYKGKQAAHGGKERNPTDLKHSE